MLFEILGRRNLLRSRGDICDIAAGANTAAPILKGSQTSPPCEVESGGSLILRPVLATADRQVVVYIHAPNSKIEERDAATESVRPALTIVLLDYLSTDLAPIDKRFALILVNSSDSWKRISVFWRLIWLLHRYWSRLWC